MFTSDFQPTCPLIYYEKNGNGNVNDTTAVSYYPLLCTRLNLNIECYFASAVIQLDGEWTNSRHSRITHCVFALPTQGTIVNVIIKIEAEDRVIMSAIVPHSEAKEAQMANKSGRMDDDDDDHDDDNAEDEASVVNPQSQCAPGLFRLPIANVRSGSVIHVSCEYIESLEYFKRGYVLSVPLYFPGGTLDPAVEWADVVQVECSVNALSKSTRVDCWSHEVTTDDAGTRLLSQYKHTVTTTKCKKLDNKAEEEHRIQQQKQNESLVLASLASSESASKKTKKTKKKSGERDGPSGVEITGRDFELCYSVRGTELEAYCIREPAVAAEGGGALCVFVSPSSSMTTTFGRAFVFLIDRSGSMAGEPYLEATRALSRALDRLRPSDTFNLCAFDHRQFYYESELVSASREHIKNSIAWVHTYQPDRGHTVLDVPIEKALDLLEESDLVPFLVLITDGSVSNERDICIRLEKRSRVKLRTRFLTFGIGSYCNWYFLQMLAKIGRGFSDVVVFRDSIYYKMDHLLRKASTPLLTEVSIPALLQMQNAEVFPRSMPDLFMGAPLLVSALYTGNDECPETLDIRGMDAHGNFVTLSPAVVTSDFPIRKIFMKQQLDQLTAQAWMSGSVALKQKIMKASVEHNMPSIYTSTVMFETTEAALHREVDSGHHNNHNNTALNKKAVIALAAIGTVVVLASSVTASLGDVQSTMDNIPILAAAAELADFDDCCAPLEDCDCGCDCNDCDNCAIM